jgi:hypothetical protein
VVSLGLEREDSVTWYISSLHPSDDITNIEIRA